MSSLTVTLIQTNLHWQNKAANLSMFSDKINSINTKTEIVVLPEMFSTGFIMQPERFAETMDGETVIWMRDIALSKKIILTGSIIIKEYDNYYNRLIWMLPNGECGYYDKRHLFAFANEDHHYKPGSKRLIASVKGWRINLQVCYDLRFPVWARQQLHHSNNNSPVFEYDLLIYTANWPERRSHPWKTLLQARAIENQCFVVGVNRVGNDGNNIYHSGDSMVVSPLGDILYHKTNEEDIFTVTLQKQLLDEVRGRFPFWKDADNFTIINE
ncbi:amidohydrolase [Panacibacter ginsenosidivorans]|uniref:Omega-amidase YafV n=1 Tax=Panacibacter ginsenosidivorans TaxID=1813871 RepID=A0A5B8VA24_9BACT|nr:amidohydrolase [Panacibacter ginsenosidivorans]QEC67711.1 amidohydrolase [Panacibacter ginsenosidivorans]